MSSVDSLDDQHDRQKQEKDCLLLANKLIRVCDLNVPSVTSLGDLQSQFFVQLFENVFGVPVPDFLPDAASYEDDAHNLQSVIDAMSLDILSISLSHITADDIMAGNGISISNLLEVFDGYIQLCLPEIVTETSSDRNEEEDDSSLPDQRTEGGTFVCNICGYQQHPPGSSLSRIVSNLDSYRFADAASCPICLNRFPDAGPVFPRSVLAAKKKKKDDWSSSLSVEIETHENKIGQKKLSKRGKRQDYEATGRHHREDKETDFAQPEPSRETSRPHVLPDHEDSSSSMSHPSDTHVKVIYTRLPSHEGSEETVRQTRSSRRKSRSSEDVVNWEDEAFSKVLKESGTQTPKSNRSRSKDPQHRSRHRSRNASFSMTKQDGFSKLCEQNFESNIGACLDQLIVARHRASQIKNRYMQSLKTPQRKKFIPICRKSYLLPYQLRVNQRRYHERMAQEASETGEPVFLREIREEFPGVELSSGTIRHMNDKFEKHLFTMHRKLQSSLRQKSQTQAQSDEAVRRQKILAEIMRKESSHNQRLSEFNEQNELKRGVMANERDTRLESARLKKYHDEYKAEIRKRLTKRLHEEEQLVKHMFEERLKLEKEQVIRLRKDLQEKRSRNAKQHKIYIESLENFYRTQFDLIEESLTVEKKNMNARAKNDQLAVDRILREVRSEMEQEIRERQKHMADNQDMHFRELDAERYRNKLRDRFGGRGADKL